MPCLCFKQSGQAFVKKKFGGSGFPLPPTPHSWALIKESRDKEALVTERKPAGPPAALMFVMWELQQLQSWDLSTPTQGMWHSFGLDCALICPQAFTRLVSGVTARWIPSKQRTAEGKPLCLQCTRIETLSGIGKSHTVLMFNILNSHLLINQLAGSQVPLYSSPFNICIC